MTRRVLAPLVAAAAAAAVLGAGGTAYADHCPPVLPDTVEKVCNNLGDPTSMECWMTENGQIVCRIPD